MKDMVGTVKQATTYSLYTASEELIIQPVEPRQTKSSEGVI